MIGLTIVYSLTITQTLNWMVRQSCEIETNIVSVESMKQYIEMYDINRVIIRKVNTIILIFVLFSILFTTIINC